MHLIALCAAMALADEPAPEPPAAATPTAPEAAPPAPNADVDALSRKVAEQQVALEVFEGSLRERFYLFNHLFASQTAPNGDYQDARFVQHRLILRPVIEYPDLAKAMVELRALDGVVWGDNAGNASTALFADTPSNTNIEGLENPSIRVERAWVEATLPIGVLRFGRQPSDWGMGLLVNPGDRFDDDFGEDKFGSTNDRILFATRPIAIGQKIAGAEDTEIPLYAAVAVDRLVEDPLVQYYGYECTPGIPSSSADYDARCDYDKDGTTDLDHGYDDDGFTEDQRGPDWWADQQDDVGEMVYVLVYRGNKVDYLKGGDLTAGGYVVNRTQKETASNVWVLDGYAKFDAFNVLFETEAVGITGKTRAITLPGSINTEAGADPLQKTAGIAGYVARGGYGTERWALRLENGYASGDEDVADATFTGRALNPDFNVGLLLYEEVLSRVTASLWTDAARGLWSNGGVYNSIYLLPTARAWPVHDLELIGSFLTAWPDRPDGAIIRCSGSDSVGCAAAPTQQATADTLGWEFDGAAKYTYKDHLLFSLEAGYAHTTDRLPLEAAGLDPDGKFFTLQSRVAWQF